MAAKRILVDDRCLARTLTGVGHYLASLVAHWPTDATVELVGFHHQRVRRHPSMPASRFRFPPLESLRPIELRPLAQLTPPNSKPSLISALKPIARKAYAKLMSLDHAHSRFHGLFEPNSLPIAKAEPTITTIFDLSAIELPEFHPSDRVSLWRRSLDRALRWTTHWICATESNASILSGKLGIERGTISVIPLASRWNDPPPDWSPSRVRRQVGLPDRYLVYLGTIEPRKNLLRLLDAYSLMPESWRNHTPLILAGAPGWGSPDYWQSLYEHPMAEHVWFTGYLSDDQAASIVYGATGLVYPSLYEGFGLPPLEAMTLGVPTLVSDIPTLREVCSSGTLYANPDDTKDWAEKLEALTDQEVARLRLAKWGRVHAKTYAWSTTARQHHDLLNRLAA